MMRVDEEAQNADSCAPIDERSPPSVWLRFYSCMFIFGGVYLLSPVWFETTKFPILTGLFSTATFTTGTLLWLRKPLALRMYIAIAIAFLVYTIYRVASEGYTFGRIGIGIGGLLMLIGYSSVAEELPTSSHSNPQDRNGGSAAV